MGKATLSRRMRRIKRFTHAHRWNIVAGNGPASSRKYKQKNLPVFRKDWDEHVLSLRGEEFERRYLMPQEKFDYLLEQCAAQSTFFCCLNEEQRRLHRCCYGCDPVDVRHKLAAALRWMSGGSYLDIRLVHGLSRTYTCTNASGMPPTTSSATKAAVSGSRKGTFTNGVYRFTNLVRLVIQWSSPATGAAAAEAAVGAAAVEAWGGRGIWAGRDREVSAGERAGAPDSQS